MSSKGTHFLCCVNLKCIVRYSVILACALIAHATQRSSGEVQQLLASATMQKKTTQNETETVSNPICHDGIHHLCWFGS